MSTANNKKWFALVVEINARKLGLAEDKTVDVLNIKCDPMMIGSLRMKEGFFPAYHMNKENWISILLDGTVSGDEIKPWLELRVINGRGNANETVEGF